MHDFDVITGPPPARRPPGVTDAPVPPRPAGAAAAAGQSGNEGESAPPPEPTR